MILVYPELDLREAADTDGIRTRELTVDMYRDALRTKLGGQEVRLVGISYPYEGLQVTRGMFV